MTDKINELLRRVEEFKPKAAAEIEEFRIRILGKKGELTALMEEFKTVAPELKRELGQQLNRLKNEATERINALREQLQNAAADEASSSGDLTRPGTAEHLGSRHPISLVKNQIVEVFSRLGYTVADGPEIEDDWHVFSALNFPPEHPARDMQDTFFIEKDPDTGEAIEYLIENMETRSQLMNRENAMRILRSKLYQRELDKRMATQQALEASKKKIEWGSQIRSYVFDDRRVKDHRTGVQTSAVESVMDGDLDAFIKAYLMEYGAQA